jgi:3-deoxy-7-phosphoheptulonate synthase
MENGPIKIEKNDFVIICGPCAIEGHDQLEKILSSDHHPRFIRGGIYKMRSSKNSFQGLGQEAISIVRNLKKKYGFKFVAEVTDPRQIDSYFDVVDVFQVGARNMYNYELLKDLSKLNRTVILKRAFSATINEWLGAAEYLHGLDQEKIILCERGIRSFDNKLRNMLDLGSVIYLKRNTNYKVFVDPSHAMGDRNYILDASYAALAAGADGLLVEVHPEPEKALSDGQQSITIPMLNEMITKINNIAINFDKRVKV